MEINYNFISIIDLLGVIQGLLFGGMLLLLHSKKNRPTLYLGLFILLFSLEPIPNILNDLGLLQVYPHLELLPVHFHFLAYPLFYIYIQKISVFGNKTPSYWTLIPGILEVLIGIVIFLLPTHIKLSLKASLFAVVYFILGLGYSIWIGVLIIRWIQIHKKEIENQFSVIFQKQLNWARFFTYASIGFQLLLIINFFIDDKQWYYFIVVINVILIYWVSFKGIVQENITSLFSVFSQFDKEPLPNATTTKPIDTVSNTTTTAEVKQSEFMTSEVMSEIIETVETYIKNSQCFTKDNLTIIDIAEATNIHPKRISYALNNQKGVNFNTYINKFRVERAKELFENEGNNNLSVEGIGMEAGFHSKATFYGAFKKFEGCTPASFRNT
ncbi:helix-turn-helix domain-containing protein [Jejuia spongiicola]|uniref:Helix-turn-helix domain-containing protein n=1 Tax=Jejuia spongiicola TaxID=2942207 RepID=A0ABT0QF50_9FLAO|nr:helix-turn-helix domain-containing protein [Jejuia spongiicola]MCL6295073.1 helix-turn-helix domain-containing protein [Jejuia spongiicola]